MAENRERCIESGDTNTDVMQNGDTVLLENPINAHETEIKFVLLK